MLASIHYISYSTMAGHLGGGGQLGGSASDLSQAELKPSETRILASYRSVAAGCRT